MTAQDGSKFLAIDNKNATVATGAFGGTQGSILASKMFIVTSSSDVLTFNYNFLTNEGPSSTWNDFAQVNIVDYTGKVIGTWKLADTLSSFVGASGGTTSRRGGSPRPSI